MIKQILTGAALLPFVVYADTLTLKNGTRFLGNFNSANSSQISFTEYSGNRQNLNVQDVQELRFGNDGQGDSANTGFGRNAQGMASDRAPNMNNGDRNQPPANAAMAEDLDRLQSDLQGAIDSNNLTGDQRQSLDDSRATLRAAAQQARNGRPVNQRNVRLALDSIRNASTRMSRQDRDVLSEDIRRVSAAVSGNGVNGGRDY